MKRITLISVVVGVLAFSAAALAAGTPFGGATVNADGTVTLVSTTAEPFSGLAFAIPAGTTFADLDTLSAEFNVTDDDCIGGSPRFQVGIDNDGDGARDGTVFIAFGPSPNFTGCEQDTWLETGNLIGNNDACRYDFSQLVPGSQCKTYDDALAALGADAVTSVSLVIDSFWAFADSEQTVIVRNVRVSPSEPRSADGCKNGGWENFGGMFKNQGDCVSFVASGGRNAPDG